MKVENWYAERTYQSKGIYRRTRKGLIIDGVKCTWKQIEAKWGITGKVFCKRLHANPNWTLEELLIRPVQKHRKKTRGSNINATRKERMESRKSGWKHLPDQLAANKVACMKWK